MELSRNVIEAAILGLEEKSRQLDEAILELRTQLNGGSATQPATSTAVTHTARRPMSASARKRIAEAQRKRWAAQKAGTAKPAAKKTAKKRVLSPEGRARIIAATKKRWAAIRKAKAAA